MARLIQRSSLFIFLLVAVAASVSSAFVAPAPKIAVLGVSGGASSSSTASNTLQSAILSRSTNYQRQPFHLHHDWSRQMASGQDEGDATKSNLPFWLDPGTKGGALVLSLILFIIPLIGYSIVTNVFGVDGIEAGKWIGIGFTAFSTVLWLSTYLFRVATKDMTYARQLKDYENAVIAKRLEELDDDEIQALVEDIERDDF